MSSRPRPTARAAALAAHAETVRACRLCPKVAGRPVAFAPPRPARLMLVGQAPGPREEGRGRLFAHTAGGRLFTWLERIGLTEERFRERVWIAAALRCFPGREGGGDRVPSPEEIARCAMHLDRELALLRPRTVLAVGRLAIAQFVPPAPLVELVGAALPVERAGVRFELIPLPHPSGRSTWLAKPAHAALLDGALARLAASLGFCEAFPELAGG